MAVDFRAPSSSKQIKNNQAYRDTRTLFEVVSDEVVKWDIAIIAIFTLCFIPFVFPFAAYFVLPLILIIYYASSNADTNRMLNVKLPFTLKGQLDKNHTKPGQSHKFEYASGTIMLGNMRTDKSEIWITGKDMLTHCLLIGTTGAGKTETLISLTACSSYCMGGGIIYVDAKAAPKLLFQFATLSQIFGRVDDIRVINYITGDRVRGEREWERLSNTTNPFAQGTANTAEQTLIGLLPPGGGDNQYFLDRAIAILRALLPALVELRDKGVINIYPSLIGEYISISKFMELAEGKIIIDGVSYDNVSLSPKTILILKTFLKQLPGYLEGKPVSEQPEAVTVQFGYAEGYFARTLASLAGTYGHIYETELAEADFVDIIMHNRILVVLVPAMEQSTEERAALGKIVLSSIRSAMAKGLGSKGEGDFSTVIESLPIDLRIPTIIIVDEYAEVAVPGFAVTATQGRGLGMSVVFAGQDLAGFVRADEAEADMIFGNTRLKVLMALEDPEITWRKFRELAGTMKVAESAGWEQDTGGINTYQQNFTTNIRDVERINILDLKEQTEGQGHLFERSNIHKVQMFHHGISDKKLIKNFRVNRMIKIKQPKPDVVEILQKHIQRNIEIEKRLSDGTFDKLQKKRINDSIGEMYKRHKKEIIENRDWVGAFIKNNSKASVANGVTGQAASNNLGNATTANATDSMMELMNGGSSSSFLPQEDTPEKNNTIVDNTTDQTIQSTEKTQPETSDIDKSVDVHVKEFAQIPSNKTDSELNKYLSLILDKVESHWVFTNQVDENGISKAKRLLDDINAINESIGGDNNNAALETLDSISIAMAYPKSEFKSLPDDIDALWNALDDIQD